MLNGEKKTKPEGKRCIWPEDGQGDSLCKDPGARWSWRRGNLPGRFRTSEEAQTEVLPHVWPHRMSQLLSLPARHLQAHFCPQCRQNLAAPEKGAGTKAVCGCWRWERPLLCSFWGSLTASCRLLEMRALRLI